MKIAELMTAAVRNSELANGKQAESVPETDAPDVGLAT